MKKGNAIKITLIISIVILLSLISFVGIYVKQTNKYENIMPDYKLGMELGKKRVVTLKPMTGTSTVIYDKEGNEVSSIPEDADASEYTKKTVENNKEEILNVENYEKAKKIIEKRLKKIGTTDYSIKYSEKTGDIIVELTEDDTTNLTVSSLTPTGRIELVDEATGEVLMSNDDFKKSSVSYYSVENGTTVYLTVEFNKEGAKKLKEISNTYVETEETDETEHKHVILKMDWPNSSTGEIEYSDVITQGFDSEITDGVLQVSVGTATTNEMLESYLEQAGIISSILNAGLVEVQYEIDGNEILGSEITNTQRLVGVIIAVAIFAVISLIIIFKYKALGILGTISNVSMIACMLILIRVAKVTITMAALPTILLMALVNTVVIVKLIKAANKKDDVVNRIWKAILEAIDLLVVILITAIVCVFMFNELIVAAGMVMFWGLISIIATNLLFTKPLLISATKN